MVGVRGTATDAGQPRAARPEGPLRVAPWATSARPADHPARPRGRRAASRPTWDEAMARIVAKSRDAPASARARSAHRLLHQRPAVPRGVLHAGRHRQGRPRHPAHGRQHPALHRHRRRGAEGVVRLRRPARLATATSTHTDAIFLFGHNMRRDPDGAVGAILDRTRGATTRRLDRLRRPATHGRRRARRADGVHLAPRARHEPRPDERPAPRAPRGRSGSTRPASTPTPWASRRCGGPSSPTRWSGSSGICGRPRRRRPQGRARSSAGAERLLSTVLQGVLPVPPGHGVGVPGQQPAPAARD